MAYPYNEILFGHKRNEVLGHARAWITLGNIMLSGRSQTQMAHVLWFRLYEIFRKGESIKTGSKLVVVRGRGWGR